MAGTEQASRGPWDPGLLPDEVDHRGVGDEPELAARDRRGHGIERRQGEVEPAGAVERGKAAGKQTRRRLRPLEGSQLVFLGLSGFPNAILGPFGVFRG